ncbi:MAG: phosphotransferase [Chloroflexota bacterium]
MSTEFQELLKHYFSINAEIFEPLRDGEENQNFKVILPHSQYLLRVYSTNHTTTGRRSKAQIEQEHRFIQHLANAQVPTPVAMKNDAGDTVIDGPDGRFAALFPFVYGQHPVRYTKDVVKQIGELLGKIRKAATSFSEQPTRQWGKDSLENYVNEYRSIESKFSGAQQLILRKLADSVESSLKKVNHLEKGFIHGDIKLGNLLYTTDGILLAIIDFDDFRESYFIEELTRTLMHDLHNPQQNAIRSGNSSHVITAYVPNKQESELLKLFLRARFLHDVGSYISRNLENLVDKLLDDEHIKSSLLI